MENLIEHVYFMDAVDADSLVADTYRWTPLKTKLGSRNVGGVRYLVLTVYWDEEPGIHGWRPNDDWTFPSKGEAQARGLSQPDFMSDILPEWEQKFAFKRFSKPRKTPEEVFKENLSALEFSALEDKAFSDAKVYILSCGNNTVDGYKECIRDAFTPVFLAYKRKGLEVPVRKYSDMLSNAFDDRFSEIVHKGIKAGLKALSSQDDFQ